MAVSYALSISRILIFLAFRLFLAALSSSSSSCVGIGSAANLLLLGYEMQGTFLLAIIVVAGREFCLASLEKI